MATAVIDKAAAAKPRATAKPETSAKPGTSADSGTPAEPAAKAKKNASAAKSAKAKKPKTASAASVAVATAASSATASGEGDPVATACPACANPQHKHTPRSEKLKKDVTTRCNRAIGQLNGIKAMIADDRYCGDVLTQLAAVESAVKAISREVMQDHLETCVVEKIQDGDVEVVDEVMGLFKKFM